jgi:hypothetical protein
VTKNRQKNTKTKIAIKGSVFSALVFFRLSDTLATEFYVEKFVLVHTTYEDGTECFETSAYKFQTLGNPPPPQKNETFRAGRKF